MIKEFAIPIEYITKYTSNETTDENIREFVKGMVEDWLNEDEDCYDHYTDLENIEIEVQKYRESRGD